MKNTKTIEVFQGLPPMAKGIIAVAVVGGVSFLIYKLYKAAQKSKELESAKEENSATKDAAKELLKQGVKPTLTNVELTSAVNGIKNAFLQYDLISRNHFQPFMHELVKVKNDLDMLNLSTAYGIQTIDFPVTKFTANDFTGNLNQSVKNFLNTSEVNAANNTLARKGIKFRF